MTSMPLYLTGFNLALLAVISSSILPRTFFSTSSGQTADVYSLSLTVDEWNSQVELRSKLNPAKDAMAYRM